MSWSSFAVGRAVTAEGDVVSYPLGYEKDGSLPWVILCHGAGGTGQGDFYMYPALWDALSERYVVGAFDFGGLYTWGNVDVSDFDAAVDFLRTVYGASEGPGVLMGTSMGGLTMSVFAKNRPTEVAGLIGMIPGWNLGSLHASNRGGFTASINAAYDGYNDVTDGPDHSPIHFVNELQDIPIQTWYASNDSIWLPADEAYFALLHENVERHSVGALDHTQAALNAVNVTSVINFIDNLF